MARKTKAKKRTRDEGRKKHPHHGVRSFWAGTISFGLVSVPVELFPAKRGTSSGLRLLDSNGTPLNRRYYCPKEERDVDNDELIRGYEVDEDEYVPIEDEELESLEPQKSREIDLRGFVDVAEISPAFFNRPYYLTPRGDSNKAYRLLAEVIEKSRRAGLATFVMRGRQYVVAIMAEHGILRAETLRFEDEIRSPEFVGLPEPINPDKQQTSSFERAIKKLSAPELDLDNMQDKRNERLLELVKRKQTKGEDVFEAEEYEPADEADEAPTIDLLETIRRSLQGKDGTSANGSSNGHHSTDRLADESKEDLYERAKKLDIAGRSGMSKQQLLRAIRKHD